MEHHPILESLEPEIAERLVVRGEEVARGASTTRATAAGLAMASIPIALAAVSRDVFAMGGLPQSVINVLNFALTLEYLESTYYDLGVQHYHIVPAQDLPIFNQIRQHEDQHVMYLQAALGAHAIAKPEFDFSGARGAHNGPFHDVFFVYDKFKALAQAFEDTGVRAYKGQAPNLISVKPILTAALQIHSVEARHASEVRRLRGRFQDEIPNRGWITENLTDIPGTAANYAGEQNVFQGGVDILALNFRTRDATEAFDEPLTTQQVLAIASQFIAA
jgi:hypothetical protein